ncbi:MAG: KH domain-containing protein [Nanoarchaeota archaeon]|nr:KH domain-containing protein [Nanoarchaeota archaeon]
MDIIKNILDELPKEISSAGFEGANIVLYTNNENFFKEGESQIKAVVDKIKKRIELRSDEKILKKKEETEETIRKLVPKEAEITNIIFDIQRSIVVIEAKKPGLVIGKQGSLLQEIRKSTLWMPQIQRSPAIPSQITENIREVLYENNSYRKKFLNNIGKKIYNEWNPEKVNEWVRLTFLGSGREVGRSCLLLQTPVSKILLDCGINVAAHNSERFPYFDVPEFNIEQLDAVILSHAHLDHCLPPHFPVLTDEGYKKIDEIIVGEKIVSLDWKTGKYIKSRCTEKTKTTGHKSVLTIKTPYSSIESSPNHRFFSFENLELKEVQASDLKKDVLIPSNILHKPEISKNKILLNTDVEYDSRRKDIVSLPTELTPELAEFLAYFMGDGHKSSEFSLRLTDASIQLLEHHKKLVKNIFNHDAIIGHHSDKTKNAFVLEINNVKIIRFLEDNFPEAFLMTNNICVPEKIRESSKEIRRAFLRGFADADGSATKTIKICSFSRNMLESLQYLFSLEGIPSNIKKDDTICLNSMFSISQFHKKIGFSSLAKQERLENLAKIGQDFKKQDLIPLTSPDLRNILKQAGMLGRIHNSPKLSSLLPMCLLDLFRRGKGYATRETVSKLVSFLEERISVLNSNYSNANLYALRHLLSITRKEASIMTGLKLHQVQQIEEKTILSEAYVSVLSSFIRERISSVILQTQNNIQTLRNLLSLNVTWERITSITERENPYEYLVDIEVENHNFVAGNIIVHNSGLLPYLYKMGYKGPVYMTQPTRDIAALLALDFIGVAYKKASSPLFASSDIKEMVKHSICLDFNEVTDITPDVRLTFCNSGHALGAAMVHLNIGNGLHNLVYTADMKYGRTRLLDPAVTSFPRVETMIIESTYGAKEDVLPQRRDSEAQLIDVIKKTIEREGKVLIPELGLGRAQETMLIIDDAVKQGLLPPIPIYIDGMIWDINAIHTAYPDFLSSTVRSMIFQDKNPFSSDAFQRVGSSQERKKVFEGGSCIVLATSGMLQGGASVEYFREFAGNKRNSIVFVCYQGVGSLGRQVQEGITEVKMSSEGKEEDVKVNFEVHTINGLTAHSGRNQLLAFVNHSNPRPKKIIINHGEASKCIDLASAIYKLNRIETVCPRNLETVRIR